jgi:DNA-binding NtrC family response regulator
MSGQDMAVRMVQLNKQLRVLLCSGYPTAVDALPLEVQENFDVLQKPFLPNMLAKSIEELLNREIG